MTQVIQKNNFVTPVKRYIDISAFHADIVNEDTDPETMVQGLYDELSTVLIGSLVHRSDSPNFHDLKSSYIKMLNGVKENVFQVSRDITEELRDEDPDLFDV